LKDDDQADADHQKLQPELGKREQYEARLLVSPCHVGDVEHGGERDDDDRHRQLGVAATESPRDRGQIVRDGDRRRGDHDQVVDQDRPPRDEADQLVEGVTSEGR